MDKNKIACKDLDAVGVYFIEGKSIDNQDITRVKVSTVSNDADLSILNLFNLSNVVYFEEFEGGVIVCYGDDPQSQFQKIECAINEIEQLIETICNKNSSEFVRLGNYYIVNQGFFDCISIKEHKIWFHDINHRPVIIELSKAPSRKEKEEFLSLLPKYESHPLCELQESQPNLVAFMKKYKRYKSVKVSIEKYKNLIKKYYGK